MGFLIFKETGRAYQWGGEFFGFGKVGEKFAGNWIHWRSKVELKVFRWKFQEIYRIDSLVLELFDVSLEFFSSRQFAMKFGPEMRKMNDLLSFTIFLLLALLFYRIYFQSSRIFSEFLAMISTTL